MTDHVTDHVADQVAIGNLDSTAPGSGARKNYGKADYSLIPLNLLTGVCHVLTFGAAKYRPFNWCKGMPWSVCFSSLMRHMFAFHFLREENDSETGCHHLDHAICNLLFLRHYTINYPDGDDRPPLYAMLATDESREEFHKRFNQ